MRDNGGELAERKGTRCEQLGSLPRERGEGVYPLEAGLGQVNSVGPREVEGKSAADGCAPSLGGMKTPRALMEARIPSVSVVPGVSVPVCVVASVVLVCVVSRCVYTSVAKCVLRRTHSGSVRACAKATPCVSEAPCVSEPPGMSEPSCVEATPSVEATPCARENASEPPCATVPGPETHAVD